MTNHQLIYIATAYRFGWTNYERYIVCVHPDKDAVCAVAENECASRAGKYGVEVVEHQFDLKGAESKTVAYYPNPIDALLAYQKWLQQRTEKGAD